MLFVLSVPHNESQKQYLKENTSPFIRVNTVLSVCFAQCSKKHLANTCSRYSVAGPITVSFMMCRYTVPPHSEGADEIAILEGGGGSRVACAWYEGYQVPTGLAVTLLCIAGLDLEAYVTSAA